jgi:signal transduction histidine kinase/CheY-like chemotaxis protein
MVDNRLPAEGGFESELRISPQPVIIALAASGFIIFVLSGVPFNLDERVRLVAFAGLVLALAAVAWVLARRWEVVGRWATVLSLVVEGYVAIDWVSPVGGFIFAALPVAVAAALINLGGAAAVAALQTLMILWVSAEAGVGAGAAGAAVAAIWLLWGVMGIVYYPVYRVARWAWEYFQRARLLLDEARDRREELEQTLEDLADANRQLTRLNLLAQGLRQAAEDARTAKEQFVANVSHELRTPLNMITGFSEMILQAPDTYGRAIPPALLADLAVVQRNAEHLAELIDDVLDLSQIEADQMALTKEYVSFEEIVETATMAVRPLFDSRGLYLRTDIQPGIGEIFCDRTRIREVILNLLSNAGRFTEVGGVTVTARKEDGELRVAVADTGLGIAARDVSKLFQPFQQVDGSIRRRYGGTGLGLSISKRFIELHGGEIWVESEPGLGTTFSFRLPVRPPGPIEEDFSRWLNPEWEFFQRTRPLAIPEAQLYPRFVVVEKGDALQRLLSRYMEDVEVVVAPTLDAALEQLSVIPAQALLINTPSVSGMLERLRSSRLLPEGTPVIVCAIPDMQDASAALGVAEHLVKPISREDLLDVLDRLGVEAGTVLIVDDEPDALQLFGRMLAAPDRRYRVLLARNGEEALNVLEEHRPDVVLLDLVMPRMDGFELLERRAELAALDDVPIVIISARDPVGQPIVSRALAVTQGGGISARHLLLNIRVLSQMLSAANLVADPGRPGTRPD